MRRYIILPLLSMSLLGAAGLHWEKAKFRPVSTSAAHGAHGGDGGSAHYRLAGIEEGMSAEVTYTLANLEQKKMSYPIGGMCLPESPWGNYHALTANAEHNGIRYSATTYIYKEGRPAKASPTKLTTTGKSPFEIRPIHLPREHDRYTASMQYGFVLIRDGKPLADTKVSFESTNGTKMELVSDKYGRFTLELPSDFKEVAKSRRGNKPADFILSSEDGSYRTSLTMPYHINPNEHWQSVPYGVLTMLLGMLAGLLLYRKVKNG